MKGTPVPSALSYWLATFYVHIILCYIHMLIMSVHMYIINTIPPHNIIYYIIFMNIIAPQIDPRYVAALEFENELRMRHQLEIQQDVEFRRRLMEEQQQQLLSELDYRNKIQQLQELQELHAQQDLRQQGVNQLMAHNNFANSQQLLELQQLQRIEQQQQMNISRDQSLLASIRDDVLLQRHQQMIQELFERQMRERLVAQSREREQEELMAILQASGRLPGPGVGGLTPAEVMSFNQARDEIIARQVVNEQLQRQQEITAPPSEEEQLEALLLQKLKQSKADSTPDRAFAIGQAYTEGVSTQDQSVTEPPKDTNGKKEGTPQAKEDPPIVAKENEKPAAATAASLTESSPKPKPSHKDTETKLSTSPKKDSKQDDKANTEENKAAIDKELDERVAKLLASHENNGTDKKTTKTKENGSPEKKKGKKRSKSEDSPNKKSPKRKKKKTSFEEGTKEASTKGIEKKEEDIPAAADGRTNLTDQERHVVNFLASPKSGKKNEKLEVNGVDLVEEKERKDDEAADIVLKFAQLEVPASDVQTAKKWNKQDQTVRTTTYPVVSPDEVPFISPGLKFNIPSLPIEPELTDAEIANLGPLIIGYRDPPPSAPEPPAPRKEVVVVKEAVEEEEESAPLVAPASIAGNVSNTIVEEETERFKDTGGKIKFLSTKRKIYKPRKAGKKTDDWWPSIGVIRKERRKLGDREDEEDSDDEADADNGEFGVSFAKAGVEAAKERLAKSVEPGVLEKLPHCKLYDDFIKDKRSGSSPSSYTPKFCCQTSETFPFEVMICCSVCSTWRHAQCGGHYRRYTAESIDPANRLLDPICDHCYLEKEFFENKPLAKTRIERQRTEHLRRSNAANAVCRQVSFGKHSGQYKWPLGSVSVSHISGHTRSVQARHEKAEKQWNEMTTRLGSGTELRLRERQRARTRDLERLMVSVEEAGKSDLK